MTDSIPVPQSRSPQFLAVCAMIGSAACWGSATVMTKGALATFGPFTLLALQLSVSVLVLWSAVLLSGQKIGPARPALRAASSGIFEPGLAYAVGVPGLALTTAGNASVIAALEPVFIVLFAWAFFGAHPTRIVVLATLIAIGGVCLVSAPDLTGIGEGSIKGDLLVLLGTAFAAIYVLRSSRLVGRTEPLVLTALQQMVGLIFVAALTVFVLLTGIERLPASVSSTILLLACGSGIVQYALAFWLYLVGLRHLPVGTAGIFLTLTPIFGVMGGMIFLGERAATVQLIGASAIIAALVMLLMAERDRGASRD